MLEDKCIRECNAASACFGVLTTTAAALPAELREAAVATYKETSVLNPPAVPPDVFDSCAAAVRWLIALRLEVPWARARAAPRRN